MRAPLFIWLIFPDGLEASGRLPPVHQTGAVRKRIPAIFEAFKVGKEKLTNMSRVKSLDRATYLGICLLFLDGLLTRPDFLGKGVKSGGETSRFRLPRTPISD
jgi:hypothetical protein